MTPVEAMPVGMTPVGECAGGQWGEHRGWVGGVGANGSGGEIPKYTLSVRPIGGFKN